jgi:hypothetical protein
MVNICFSFISIIYFYLAPFSNYNVDLAGSKEETSEGERYL